MIDYTNLQTSLKNLERFWEAYEHLKKPGEALTIHIHKMAIIQAFEVCYEALLKVLQRYLSEEIGASNTPSGPKPLLRAANKNSLLSSAVEEWIRYVDVRNKTSHEYGIQHVDEAIKLVPNFIKDAIDLYQAMSKKSWG